MFSLYFQAPTTAEEWMAVASDFERRWNYPFCLGALDGKHIGIEAPANSGSTYFNYKHFFSTVMLALVDVNCKFLYIDIGSQGRCCDAGVFEESSLKHAMNTGMLNFPQPGILPGTDKTCMYHIIGDGAFPLRSDLMKPFPHKNLDKESRIFNYRFSRARRVVENAFGILSKRFRVFLNKINLQPEFVDKLALAACCLHNFLIENQSSYYIAQLADREDHLHGMINGQWREGQQLQDLEATVNRNPKLSAKQQRELLKEYFSSEFGAVSWQDAMIS